MKRITFITGYFGSGKTEIALNLAVQKRVNILLDLDIVNPYFRSREQEPLLKELGIRTISSGLVNSPHADLPFLAKEVYIPFHDQFLSAVYDLGGSGSGARLIRQFKDYLPNDEVDLLFCVNINREVTDTAEKIIEEIHIIESSGGVRPTGLINNSNFLKETTVQDIIAGEKVLLSVAKATKLPIVYTGVVSSIDSDDFHVAGEKIILKLYFNKHWL
ncbi:MAG: hypothetical protein PHT27_05080 [Candidatus Izemoplasmatales bacterium]|jgi:hypothetical protein|nr:hypothetical protein [Candidatus Izemoplasmatales bacterium]